MTKINFMILFLLLLIFGVYWQWWVIGPKVANDFPLVSQSVLKSSMNFPQAWSELGAEGLGEYSVFTLWSWPQNFLSGLLANLGLSFLIVERILLMIPFLILGVWSMWSLGKSVKLSSFANFIATLFYMANSYILLVLDGGQLTIGLAYAFFPLSFLVIKNSINKGFKSKVLAGFSVWILGIFDFRFIYVLILLCLIYFIYELFLTKEGWKNCITSWLKTSLIIGFIVIGLNAYWLIPIIKTPLTSETIGSLTQTNFVSFINLGHSMLMLSPNWFKNIFGEISSLRFEFILLPFLVFLAPILRPKNKNVGFWLLAALVSIFLTKGFSPPLGVIYQWLFKNLPGFSLFRDPTKFFFISSLSYAILIGISVDEILKRVRKFKGLNTIILSLLTLYLLFIIRPVWTLKMNGTFSTAPFGKDYKTLYQILDSDKQFSKIFWIPSIPPLGPLTSEHPSLEAARLVQKRPFAIGTIGSYETFNFLREAPYMGEIFDITGIGYIVYPYLDVRRDNLHPDNIKYYYLFSSQLSKLPWLDKVEESKVPTWKVKHTQDKFFFTQNTFWVIGSDSIYNEATKSSKLKLSKNALIFPEESAGLGYKLDLLPSAKIILNNKGNLDLAASFIKLENLTFPAKNLGYDPDITSGWWKREAWDLISWRDFLKNKYGLDNQDFDLGGGWAVGEGDKELKISSGVFKKGNIVLARVLESTRSGQLKFYQDTKQIGEINTKKEGNNIRWFEVGELFKDGGPVEIKSFGDINVVNALAILDKNKWLGYQDKANNLKGRVVNFDEKNIQNDNNTAVTYQEIDPTRYKIVVSNLKEPGFLVFSQTYNSNWKLNSQASLPVYSLLNGFRIEKNGEYFLEFEPQKYVYPGLIISSITLIIAILLLIRPSKPRKFHI